MDRNGYYGGESASLTPLDDVSEREGEEREKPPETPLDEGRDCTD